MVAHPRRHEPCIALCERGIPCLVWFEDTIALYGVPTVVFDLHLLVPDIDEAARALIEKGWTDAGPLDSTYHFLMGPISQRRLNPPNYIPESQKPNIWPPPPPSKDPPGPTTTVLLPAVDWNVPVDKLRLSSLGSFVPPLDLVLDALIDSFLDAPFDTLLQTQLNTYISYLYGYCMLLKTPTFATNLRLDHRQFHYDMISKRMGMIPFIEEQRQIRDEIREGKWQPRFSTWHVPQHLVKDQFTYGGSGKKKINQTINAG